MMRPISGKPCPWLWKGKGLVAKLLANSPGISLTLIDTQSSGGEAAAASEEIAEPAEPTTAGERAKLTDFLDAGKIRVWEEPITKDKAIRELVDAFGKSNPGLNRPLRNQFRKATTPPDVFECLLEFESRH